MPYPLPLDMLYHWEQTRPDAVFLRQPVNDRWITWTWKQTVDEAGRMATYLRSLNLPPRSNIALLSKNCAHWVLCDLAIMMSGHVSIPLYPNLSAHSIRQILEHSEAPVLFVGKLDNWAAMRPGVPDGVQAISFPAYYGSTGYTPWEDIIQRHSAPAEHAQRRPGDLMTIIYTSGSTGMPKGVMHKYANVAFAATEAVNFVQLSDQERFFSYLPMAHVGERFLVEMGVLYSGGTVYFSESLDKFPQNLREARPTIFLGVHRIWKKFQDGVLARLPQQKLDRLLRIPLVSNLVRRKIKKGLGLDQAKWIFTSASPTPPELIEWYKSVGLRIIEGYSMTENFAYSHSNPFDRIKIGSVGKPLPNNEFKLGEDNEVLVRNAAVMDGYYKDPELTRLAFTNDGFLRTGDEGRTDDEGYLYITGRTKDIFKTSKGKYVTPSPIEMMLSANTDLEFSCIVGTSLPQPIALVTLTASARQKSPDTLRQELARLLGDINTELDQHQQLEKIVVLPGEWSPDNGMLTPTFKIKRREIEQQYADLYEQWYGEKEMVLFA